MFLLQAKQRKTKTMEQYKEKNETIQPKEDNTLKDKNINND